MKLILMFALVAIVVGRNHNHGHQRGDKHGGRHGDKHGGRHGDKHGGKHGNKHHEGDNSSSSSSSSSSSDSFSLSDAARAIKRALNPNYDSDWDKFKNKHKRSFEKEEEEKLRRQIWEERLEHMNQHNTKFDKGLHKFKIGMNPFSDMAHRDFVKINGFKMPNMTGMLQGGNPNSPQMEQKFNLTEKDVRTKNETVDWRMEGIVSPVQDQGTCGSCWSFASAGSLEGVNALKNGKLVPMSQQNLIDCTTNQGNSGCNGGAMMYAYQYVIKNDGIDSLDSYPYKGEVQNTCGYSADKKAGTAKGFVNVPKGDEEALRLAVASIGPISVAIDASLETFQLYQEGIYDDARCNSTALDHGVLVVGYGSENGSDYWLVKNSWGTDWGMDGYIKMARNEDNKCGIASTAVYPLV